METFLYVLHIVVCLAMLPIILLQSGKGGGVSAVFGGGGAGTVFGSRGASAFLTRMTTGAAFLFMCTSIALSLYSSRSKSVLGDLGRKPAQSASAATSPADVDQATPIDQAVAPTNTEANEVTETATGS